MTNTHHTTPLTQDELDKAIGLLKDFVADYERMGKGATLEQIRKSQFMVELAEHVNQPFGSSQGLMSAVLRVPYEREIAPPANNTSGVAIP